MTAIVRSAPSLGQVASADHEIGGNFPLDDAVIDGQSLVFQLQQISAQALIRACFGDQRCHQTSRYYPQIVMDHRPSLRQHRSVLKLSMELRRPFSSR